jgi:hypothetical protein
MVVIIDVLVRAAGKALVSALVAIAQAFVAALWKAYKSKIVLGSAIFGFSASGLAMVIGSRAVTGWNQAALLGFGTSLLIVGTVELGVLGVLNKIIDPDRTGGLIKDLSGSLALRFAALEDWLGMPQSWSIGREGLGELRADRQTGIANEHSSGGRARGEDTPPDDVFTQLNDLAQRLLLELGRRKTPGSSSQDNTGPPNLTARPVGDRPEGDQT